MAGAWLGRLWLWISGVDPHSFGPSLPRAADDFLLPDINGQVVRLSQLKGKIVFLNVWTTW